MKNMKGMKNRFGEKKEPLFGRADRILCLKPFPVQALVACYPRHKPEWFGLSVENISDYLPKGR